MGEDEQRVEVAWKFTGDRIRRARRAHQRGVAQLAEVVGVGQAVLAAMERGEVAVGSDVLCALADELDVRPSVLRGYEIAGQVTDDPDGIERMRAEALRSFGRVRALLEEIAADEGEGPDAEVVEFPGRAHDRP